MVMFNRYLRGQDLAALGGLPLRGGRNGPVREAASHTSLGASQSDAATRGEFVPGPLPFRDVFIHALIMDGDGQKMSKSLGNGVDPLDIIESHGADAMRFVLCQMTTQTQDVRMPVQKGPNGKNTSPKFDIGRNFCNKLWNASRFALTMLEGSQAASQRSTETARKSLVDRWMLSRLAAAVEQVNTALANYEYSDYATALYDLMWRDFCDWYIEAVKPTISTNTHQRAVLAHTLESIVRLLHPITPFITEALWERLKDIETQPIPGVELSPARIAGTLATAGWPRVEASLRDAEAESQFERLRSLITAIREVRAQHNVPPKRRITLHTPTSFSPEESSLIETLAGVERITTQIAPADSAPFIHEGQELRLSNLADAVDSAAERARLEKAIADADKAIATLQGRLSNPGYAQKAPPAMVEQTKSQLAKAQADREAATAALARL
jgi:valyl-tRNA synthetase